MIPFLIIVSFFLIIAIVFILLFSRKIFTTINILAEKIDMLNKHHKVKAKHQRRIT